MELEKRINIYFIIKFGIYYDNVYYILYILFGVQW